MKMSKSWCLFGTGRMMPFYRSLIEKFGETVAIFCDNDQAKWGQSIGGIVVVSPAELVTKDVDILISCNAESEIEEELLGLGIKRDRIYDYSRLLRYYIALRDDSLNMRKYHFGAKNSIILDAYDGVGYGGMELWSYRVAEELDRRGQQVMVIGSDSQLKQDKWEHLIRRLDYKTMESEDYWSPIEKIVDFLKDQLPFILINNWSDRVLAAALILKKQYPDLVHIISIVHFDARFMYRRIRCFYDEMDSILCVSKKICGVLHEDYGVPQEKLCYHINFIDKAEGKCENNRKKDEPLRIGWGARMEIDQKRADLLPALIGQLDAAGLRYRMELAGEGAYREILSQWVSDNGKQDHIILHGHIPTDEMKDFWKRQDIYINLSEFEGGSLAMLEAMAGGAVPVVTDVSGTRDVLENIDPELIKPIGDISAIGSEIIRLGNDEKRRRELSARCCERVATECRFDKYVDDLEGMIEQSRRAGAVS
ncbi:MAG: glycosyltransferase family 4 protein [Lachnospiraceae bacterium]|nr:glycosyltransferase family 4 protein [Lachnospiraceae bacterium]